MKNQTEGQRFSALYHLLALASVSVFAAFWAIRSLGARALNPSNFDWMWGDFATTYASWHEYLKDPQSHGLAFSRMSDPIPISASLFDPMPLFLLIAKLFSPFLPSNYQFIGSYFVLCLVLQAAFAYLAIFESLKLAGRGRPLEYVMISTLGALIISSLPFTLNRFTGHIALSSQWVILASIYVSLQTLHANNRQWLTLNCLVVLFVSGINPYLSLMVLLSISALNVYQWLRKDVLFKDVILRTAAIVFFQLLGWYAFGFLDSGLLPIGGYGLYSMNILGPFDSNGHGRLLTFNIADPTGGQSFEGFNYIGFGVILLTLIGTLSFVKSQTEQTHFPFWGVFFLIVFLYFFSLSNVLTFASKTLTIPIPGVLQKALSLFRVSGRFFWPAGFWLIIASIAALALQFKPRTCMAILAAICAVQLYDVADFPNFVRNTIKENSRLALPSMPTDNISKLLVYPPWQCDPHGTAGGVRNFEMVTRFIQDNNLTTNSFYAARNPRNQIAYHCDYKARLASLDPKAIYLLSAPLYDQFQPDFVSQFACNETKESTYPAFWICRPR